MLQEPEPNAPVTREPLDLDLLVVGLGPFGISAAAWAIAAGLKTASVGADHEMSTWSDRLMNMSVMRTATPRMDVGQGLPIGWAEEIGIVRHLIEFRLLTHLARQEFKASTGQHLNGEPEKGNPHFFDLSQERPATRDETVMAFASLLHVLESRHGLRVARDDPIVNLRVIARGGENCIEAETRSGQCYRARWLAVASGIVGPDGRHARTLEVLDQLSTSLPVTTAAHSNSVEWIRHVKSVPPGATFLFAGGGESSLNAALAAFAVRPDIRAVIASPEDPTPAKRILQADDYLRGPFNTGLREGRFQGRPFRVSEATAAELNGGRISQRTYDDLMRYGDRITWLPMQGTFEQSFDIEPRDLSQGGGVRVRSKHSGDAVLITGGIVQALGYGRPSDGSLSDLLKRAGLWTDSTDARGERGSPAPSSSLDASGAVFLNSPYGPLVAPLGASDLARDKLSTHVNTGFSHVPQQNLASALAGPARPHAYRFSKGASVLSEDEETMVEALLDIVLNPAYPGPAPRIVFPSALTQAAGGETAAAKPAVRQEPDPVLNVYVNQLSLYKDVDVILVPGWREILKDPSGFARRLPDTAPGRESLLGLLSGRRARGLADILLYASDRGLIADADEYEVLKRKRPGEKLWARRLLSTEDRRAEPYFVRLMHWAHGVYALDRKTRLEFLRAQLAIDHRGLVRALRSSWDPVSAAPRASGLQPSNSLRSAS